MSDRRLRLTSLSAAPEVMSYLALSLRAWPSIERAIAFAADHAAEPFASGLRRVLWRVHLRDQIRTEDALLAAADGWRVWSGEVGRAVHTVVHAVKQGSSEGLVRALDRARALVFDGTRRRTQAYAAGLRAPTSALFALGVLLPLILGSMLPLLSLGAFEPTSLQVDEPPPPDPLPWILLLDVGLPAFTFALAHHVSSGRPGPTASGPRLRIRAMAPLLLIPIPVLLALQIPHPLAPVLAFGGVVAVLAPTLYVATRGSEAERMERKALEAQLPDALFQLGSRLGEGRGIEDAFFAVAREASDSEAGRLFGRIARSMRLGGGTLEGAMFGPSGALEDVTSRPVRASLRMVVDLSTKDPEVAGRATLEMAAHLRELQDVEEDLRAAVRPTIDAMRATVAMFAPIVLGVTGALYARLGVAFQGIASLPMAAPTFQLALAVFLALVSAAIIHFRTRMESLGLSRSARTISLELPLGFGVFLVTLALAGLVL